MATNYLASLGKTSNPEPATTQNYATEMTNLLRAHNAWFNRVPKARRVSEANELEPFVMCHCFV